MKMDQIKVMLVDDEERFLQTTRKLLGKKGIDALTASNGADALKMLGSQSVDIVILDVRMPGMDGLKTLREIKKIDDGMEVIILTGHASVDAAVEGIKWGAYDFLIKPCDPEELIAKIEGAYELKMGRDKRNRNL